MNAENLSFHSRNDQPKNSNAVMVFDDLFVEILRRAKQERSHCQTQYKYGEEKHRAAEIVSKASRKGMIINGAVMGTFYAAADCLLNKAGLSFGTVWQTAVPVFAASYYVIGDVVGYINGYQNGALLRIHNLETELCECMSIPYRPINPLSAVSKKTRDTIKNCGFWLAAGLIGFNAYGGEMHVLPVKPVEQKEEKPAPSVEPQRTWAPNTYVMR